MKKEILKKGTMAVLITSIALTAAAHGVPANSALAAETEFTEQQQTVLLNEADVRSFAESFFTDEKLKAWDVPGAIVSVVQNNRIVYQQGFGVADTSLQTPVQPDQTTFRTGSVSKVVTATALMQLVEQGKVSLDAGVNEYLPEPWIAYSEDQPVTIRHLLTHTTGFDGGLDIRPGDIYYTLEDYYDLGSYVKESIPAVVRTPGEVFKYDNFASMLQGFIVEQVSKQSFEDYVQEHIFGPLNMKYSGFRVTSEAAASMATAYMAGGQELPQYSIKPSDHPQGGWYTTAEDAAIFMMVHLNKGSYEGVQILKPETAELMQQYQVYIQPESPVMAFGFEASMFPQYDRGQRVISKGGDTLGFSSAMWLLPEHQIGFFISVNGNNGLVREEFYRDFMSSFIPDISVKKEALETPEAELKIFEGNYMDLRLESWKSKISVAGAGKLAMEDSLYGNIEFIQTGPMTFVDSNGRELVFKANDSGEPQYFKYLNVGYSMRVDEKTYSDVPQDAEYAPFIYTLRDFNVFKEEADVFRPDEAITRGEYLSYFVRLLKLPLSPNPSSFEDTKGHVFEHEIQTGAELGLVNGRSGGSYAPDQALTREEAALMIYRLLKLQGAGVAPGATYNEAPSEWAADAVNMMLYAGFFGPEVTVNDNGQWNYRPHDIMLRKEAAALLATLVQIPQQSSN